MTANAQAAFDPKPKRLGTVIDCIASGTILAGDVVGFNATGADWTVQSHVTGTTVAPLGVALYGVTTGQHVAIASTGSIVRVKNALTTADLDAGTQIMGSGTTAGLVIAYADAADAQPFGYLLEALASTPAYAYIFGPVLVAKGT
jgi:hypothetical protein